MEDIEMANSVSNDVDYSPWMNSDTSLGSLSSLDDARGDTSSETCVRRASESCLIVYSSDSESDEDNKDNIRTQIVQEEWLEPVGNQPQITPFVGRPGMKLFKGDFSKIEHFYSLLVTDDLFQEISNQTNLYASQVLSRKQSSRLDDWVPTSQNEIKSFFGLIIWMGIVKLPELTLYWSRDPIFAQNFPRSIMSRNRFELLLRMLHFTNNEDAKINERLYKIKLIVDALTETFEKHYDPPEALHIDESLIPFRDCINPRQYVKQKRPKYDFKIFKLCSKQGYTHRFKIYVSKKSDTVKVNPTNVILSLCERIVGKGHTIYTDDRYTSIELARQLINKNTNLVGTVSRSSHGLNKEVIIRRLKQGEIFAREHRTGITLMKWRDKRDVLALSTKHSIETVITRKRSNDNKKPALISDYNDGKCSVDMSDQTMVYNSPLRKRLKWYKKLAIEFLLNTAVVNAWVMYNSANRSPISILEYKKRLVGYLCNCKHKSDVNDEESSTSTTKKPHELIKDIENPARRRRCISCYKQNVKNFNSEIARTTTKRVTTFCQDCPDKPHLCLQCFNEVHRNIRL